MATQRRVPQHGAATADANATVMAAPTTETSSEANGLLPLHGVDEVFDYASFMWDSGDIWQQVNQDNGTGLRFTSSITVSSMPDRPLFATSSHTDAGYGL
jgi:hypothetical protein